MKPRGGVRTWRRSCRRRSARVGPDFGAALGAAARRRPVPASAHEGIRRSRQRRQSTARHQMPTASPEQRSSGSLRATAIRGSSHASRSAASQRCSSSSCSMSRQVAGEHSRAGRRRGAPTRRPGRLWVWHRAQDSVLRFSRGRAAGRIARVGAHRARASRPPSSPAPRSRRSDLARRGRGRAAAGAGPAAGADHTAARALWRSFARRDASSRGAHALPRPLGGNRPRPRPLRRTGVLAPSWPAIAAREPASCAPPWSHLGHSAWPSPCRGGAGGPCATGALPGLAG